MMDQKKNDFKQDTKTKNPEDQKRLIKESEINGTIIIFDMTNSTMLKKQRGFPGWLPDLQKFDEIVSQNMMKIGGKWKKFIGDAYMFFFHDDQGQVTDSINQKSPDIILNTCETIMHEFWDFYDIYKNRTRGDDKGIDFREITCAIDYGDEIVNWYETIDDNYDGLFDPLGTPVDRCFRISSIAGPSQLLVSKYFYDKLQRETKEKFIKIHIKENTLKGFDKEDIIYYLRPKEDVVDYLLSPSSVQLVEESKDMSVKVKLKLLHEVRKIHYPDKYNGV